MDTGDTLLEIAQPHCDDVVLAAALFVPNAAGLRDRQLLKCRCAYLADRVLLAVTTLQVVALSYAPVLGVGASRAEWRHRDLVMRAVEPKRTFGLLPALELEHRHGWPALEIAPIADDETTMSLFERLLEALAPARSR